MSNYSLRIDFLFVLEIISICNTMSTKDTSLETDIIIELLEIYINSILFARELYPAAIFRERKAYNIPLRISIFKPLNEYLEKTLLTARELKQLHKLTKVEILIYKDETICLESYVFELEDREFPLETDDHSIELEAQVRKSLLNLDSQLKGLRKLPSDATFKVLLHTTEAAFARIEHDPQLQNYPFVQETSQELKHTTNTQLLPVSHTTTVGIQLYVEEYL
ncbi:DNA polymerase zeta subunit 2 [Toxorhynchites rutilus septentrionalis]|uniref:DNA polymerase zeta subunit 2 n=1 Tax=Toxorhynchites rutilus septentrionalis TaxID=329112 RepID=UPI00247A20B1|nr:DNA polymerase zeta subunit 2 [Toxorhynchites rutilus septentrionalis]